MKDRHRISAKSIQTTTTTTTTTRHASSKKAATNKHRFIHEDKNTYSYQHKQACKLEKHTAHCNTRRHDARCSSTLTSTNNVTQTAKGKRIWKSRLENNENLTAYTGWKEIRQAQVEGKNKIFTRILTKSPENNAKKKPNQPTNQQTTPNPKSTNDRNNNTIAIKNKHNQ